MNIMLIRHSLVAKRRRKGSGGGGQEGRRTAEHLAHFLVNLLGT